MVILLKLSTMCLPNSGAWDLAHFGVLLYRNGEQSTRRRNRVKSLDRYLIVSIDSSDLWAPIDDLATFNMAVLCLADTIA